jgi:hypothetical protein
VLVLLPHAIFFVAHHRPHLQNLGGVGCLHGLMAALRPENMAVISALFFPLVDIVVMLITGGFDLASLHDRGCITVCSSSPPPKAGEPAVHAVYQAHGSWRAPCAMLPTQRRTELCGSARCWCGCPVGLTHTPPPVDLMHSR